MKVSIDEKGMMLIEAETPLESYALSKWCDDYMVNNHNDHITIKTGIEPIK